jgi:hypothetical protein
MFKASPAKHRKKPEQGQNKILKEQGTDRDKP